MLFKTQSGHYVQTTYLGNSETEFITKDADRNVISTVRLTGYPADQMLAALRSPGGRA